MSTLLLERYEEQRVCWPRTGRHILAQFDEETVVVYQAYRPEIGLYAAKHGRFGGGFSFTRMSWVKPNFLWMMFRSGWGTKEAQEVTLALRMARASFEALLEQAVPSSFSPLVYESEDAWRAAVASSSVRLQWDPDHDPRGAPIERRALQLGLRGGALDHFAREAILEIEDISALVAEQRGRSDAELVLPRERVYPLPPHLGARLGISAE